jgi:hypothetical protein
VSAPLTPKQQIILNFIKGISFQAGPSITQIAHSSSLSRRHVMRIIQTLEKRSLIQVTRTQGKMNFFKVLGGDMSLVTSNSMYIYKEDNILYINKYKNKKDSFKFRARTAAGEKKLVGLEDFSMMAIEEVDMTQNPPTDHAPRLENLGGVIEIRGKTKKASRALKTGDKNFDLFYDLYPRKVDRAAAYKAWLKLSPDDLVTSDILRGVQDYLLHCHRSNYFSPERQQYIKHPATFLNGRSWENQNLIVLSEMQQNFIKANTIQQEKEYFPPKFQMIFDVLSGLYPQFFNASKLTEEIRKEWYRALDKLEEHQVKITLGKLQEGHWPEHSIYPPTVLQFQDKARRVPLIVDEASKTYEKRYAQAVSMLENLKKSILIEGVTVPEAAILDVEERYAVKLLEEDKAKIR